MTTAPSSPSSSNPAVLVLASVGLILALLAVVALWRVGDGLQQEACVAKVEARYPAVPVSAFNTKTTGPLKLSFATERAKAVADC